MKSFSSYFGSYTNYGLLDRVISKSILGDQQLYVFLIYLLFKLLLVICSSNKPSCCKIKFGTAHF